MFFFVFLPYDDDDRTDIFRGSAYYKWQIESFYLEHLEEQSTRCTEEQMFPLASCL